MNREQIRTNALWWALVHLLLVCFSAISFFYYGSCCFLSPYIRGEFTRWGFERQRRMIGALQLAGAAGLIIGLAVPWIGQFAAGGLAVMMLFGVAVRIKIRDTPLQTSPALLYLAVNTYLALGVRHFPIP